VLNLPTVYTLLLPEEVQRHDPDPVVPRKRHRKAPISVEATETQLPPPKPQEPSQVHAEAVEPFDADEYAAYLADAPMPEDEPVEAPTVESLPALTPEPVDVPTVQAQSPDGFTEREQAVASIIAEKTRVVLSGPLQDDALRASAVNGWLAIVAARYTLGRDAIRIMGEYGIGLKEIDAAVSEWARKAVLNQQVHPLQLAMRLQTFLLEKGRSVDRMRKRKLGIG
jgi:hypothetical protein